MSGRSATQQNPSEWAEYQREYYRRPGVKERKRRGDLIRKYGLTLEDYESLLDSQGGACAVCARPFDSTPHVDHDHASGRVRGLTCSACNRGLGMFGDSPEMVSRALVYLESFV